MIYDGHVYVVPDQRGRMGYETRKEFMGHLQWGMAVNFQPAWRASDGAPGDSSGMYDPSAGPRFDALKECNFRPAGYGRYEWEVDGETYVRQVMPPTNIINGYTAEQLVAEMDHADVEWGMVHRSTYLAIGNEWVADCVRRFPDRLHGLAHVEEWLVQPQPGRVDRQDREGRQRAWPPRDTVAFASGPEGLRPARGRETRRGSARSGTRSPTSAYPSSSPPARVRTHRCSQTPTWRTS